MATELITTHDDIYKDVRAYLMLLFPEVKDKVIRGYSNNVPLPESPFILMNIIHEKAVSTNVHDFSVADGNAEVMQTIELMMQIDFYGEQAGTMARKFTHLWRDFHACENLTCCQPLYCDEAKYLPFTNEKSNYESRFMTTATLNYNPVVIHDQDFITDPQINIHLL
ncbi:phage neck terminator protein [Testudinibacter sp. P80/BLE/0925]